MVISHEGVVSHGEAVDANVFSLLPDRPSIEPSGPGIVITLQGRNPLRDPRVITLSDLTTAPLLAGASVRRPHRIDHFA